MRLLAIETSTICASVALCVGHEIFERKETSLNRHALWVLPTISELLTEANIDLSQLDGLVFGAGPGSFTGVRIALGIVKGLALAHDLPVYPVCTLGAIRNEVLSDIPVLSVLDARMQQYYWALNADGSLEGVFLSSLSEIKEKVKEPFVLAGVGDIISEPFSIFPSARSMIDLVLKGKIAPISAEVAAPYYVRNQVVF